MATVAVPPQQLPSLPAGGVPASPPHPEWAARRRVDRGTLAGDRRLRDGSHEAHPHRVHRPDQRSRHAAQDTGGAHDGDDVLHEGAARSQGHRRELSQCRAVRQGHGRTHTGR